MRIYEREIGGMTLSGKFFNIVVWNPVIISQWGMKILREKEKGYKAVDQF